MTILCEGVRTWSKRNGGGQVAGLEGVAYG